MTKPAAETRDRFSLFRPLQTRWADNDVYGHVNNVVHYALFDTAINGWLLEKGLLDFKNGQTVGLVVETGCSYFSEMIFPDRVDAGIGVERIGTSSVTYRVALFRNDETQAAAQGHFVHVYVDRESRRPKPLRQPVALSTRGDRAMTETTVAERLDGLEEHAAHQARIIDELSEQLNRQWAEMDTLRRKQKLLIERLLALEEQSVDAPAITKPPHY